MTAAASLLSAALALWCVVHAVHYARGLERASDSFCGTCYNSIVEALGLPLHHTISLGLLSGGAALVGAIQAIRFVNGARTAGRTGEPC